jgi:hypothetical protein
MLFYCLNFLENNQFIIVGYIITYYLSSILKNTV